MKRINIKKVESDNNVLNDSIVKTVIIDSRKLLIHLVGNSLSKIEKDSIVWVKPNEKTTAEELAQEVKRIEELGVARVLPLPLESLSAVVPNRVLNNDERITYTGVGVREAIEFLLDNVKEMKQEVATIVEDALQEVGI